MSGKKAIVTVVSGPTMKETLGKLNAIVDRLEKRENESITRKVFNVLKMPVIGKPRAKKDASD
jgi:hypothetical protein